MIVLESSLFRIRFYAYLPVLADIIPEPIGRLIYPIKKVIGRTSKGREKGLQG